MRPEPYDLAGDSVYAIARQAARSRYRAWTTDTASVPPSPWQTLHASPPTASCSVSACAAAAAAESWQARARVLRRRRRAYGRRLTRCAVHEALDRRQHTGWKRELLGRAGVTGHAVAQIAREAQIAEVVRGVVLRRRAEAVDDVGLLLERVAAVDLVDQMLERDRLGCRVGAAAIAFTPPIEVADARVVAERRSSGRRSASCRGR
mgnify:CR=1 FL=1